MRNPYGSERPPEGHANLNAWLMHTASHHEAAHAVAAHCFHYPFHYVALKPINDGFVGENAHFVRDIDAVKIALAFLDDRSFSCTKAVVTEYAVLEVAKAVNVMLNGIAPEQAASNAQADHELQDEMFDINPALVPYKNDIIRLANDECKRLLASQEFQVAVGEVAGLLARYHMLSDSQVSDAVARVTSSAIRPGVDMPSEGEIRSEAYFLFTRKLPSNGPLGDWLSSERGLRFARFCSS